MKSSDHYVNRYRDRTTGTPAAKSPVGNKNGKLAAFARKQFSIPAVGSGRTKSGNKFSHSRPSSASRRVDPGGFRVAGQRRLKRVSRPKGPAIPPAQPKGLCISHNFCNKFNAWVSRCALADRGLRQCFDCGTWIAFTAHRPPRKSGRARSLRWHDAHRATGSHGGVRWRHVFSTRRLGRNNSLERVFLAISAGRNDW